MWPTTSVIDLFQVKIPIIQAPMAGANGAALAVAVSQAGGVGFLPCAMLSPENARAEIALFRQQASGPLGLNFFCHENPTPDANRDTAWQQRLAGYYEQAQLDPQMKIPAVNRAPFDDAMCAVVEAWRPEVVSFHFGLPEQSLLERVKATGARVLSSATTVAEARWLDARGCDAIIAQGYEAGGHRGMFLSDDINVQPGTFALVPQVVDAVNVPVIAAGGIGDGRGIAAAFALGAAGVQIGTAYLPTPQSLISPLHRQALGKGRDDMTALTNLFSGRPARGIVNQIMREIGPISALAPAFPTAGGALAPLKAHAEKAGSVDFTSLWAGQAVALGQAVDATELTRRLADDALRCMRGLGCS
jgi:nitronate monooxygenase